MNSENDIWNRYARTLRRRQQADRALEWLREHPFWNWVFGCAFMVTLVFFALFVRWLVLGCLSCDPLNR